MEMDGWKYSFSALKRNGKHQYCPFTHKHDLRDNATECGGWCPHFSLHLDVFVEKENVERKEYTARLSCGGGTREIILQSIE